MEGRDTAVVEASRPDLGVSGTPDHITVHVSKTRWPGRIYYCNHATGQCTWAHPNAGKQSETKQQRAVPTVRPNVTSEPRSSTSEVEEDRGPPPQGQSAPAAAKFLMPTRTLCPSCNRVASTSTCNSVKDVIVLLTPQGASGMLICTCQVRGRLLIVLDRLLGAAEKMKASSPDMVDYFDSSCYDWIERRISDPENKSMIRVGTEDDGSPLFSGSPIPSLPMVVDDDFGAKETLQQRATDRMLAAVFELEPNTHPTISLSDYLNRLWRYCRVSDATFLVSLVLLLRLARSGRLILNERTIHKALLAAVVIAAKVNEDSTLSNKSFAVVGGISVLELNRMELALCLLLRWKLDVSVGEWVAAAAVLF